MAEQKQVCAECGLPAMPDHPLTDWAGTLYHGSDELCIHLLVRALAASLDRTVRAEKLLNAVDAVAPRARAEAEQLLERWARENHA